MSSIYSIFLSKDGLLQNELYTRAETYFYSGMYSFDQTFSRNIINMLINHLCKIYLNKYFPCFLCDSFTRKHGDRSGATSSSKGVPSCLGITHHRIGTRQIRGDLFQDKGLASAGALGTYHC